MEEGKEWGIDSGGYPAPLEESDMEECRNVREHEQMRNLYRASP